MATILDLDSIDRAILEELQRDGRQPITDLATTVSMSASAVKERVRRMEERGVITSYAAVVDPAAVGHSIMAFVRLRYPTTKYQPFYDLIDRTPEILEVHHITGEDCFIVKVAAESMAALEDTTSRIGQLGAVTTNIVYSSPLARRSVTPPPNR